MVHGQWTKDFMEKGKKFLLVLNTNDGTKAEKTKERLMKKGRHVRKLFRVDAEKRHAVYVESTAYKRRKR